MDEKSFRFDVFPSEDTLSVFEDMGIFWRKIDNKFFALIRENDLHEPFINVPPAKRFREFFSKNVFRLYLKTEDTSFLNYTNIPVEGKQIIYLSNLVDNRIPVPLSSPFLYLSQKIGDLVTGREYFPGNFSINPGTGMVFETLKRHISSGVSDLSDGSLWRSRQKKQFPSVQDQITYTDVFFDFILSASVSVATINVFGFNFDPVSPDFTTLLKSEVQQFSSPVSTVKVDLRDLPSGRYKIDVDGTTRLVYLDTYLVEDNAFGVIEIFNYLPGTDDYSFLDSGEVIIRKDFTVRFPARNVLWKYIRKDNKAQSITDTGLTNYVFNLANDFFVSAQPIPLSETPLNTLKLVFNTTDHDLFPLPNPEGDHLGRHHQDNFDHKSADIFLNY